MRRTIRGALSDRRETERAEPFPVARARPLLAIGLVLLLDACTYTVDATVAHLPLRSARHSPGRAGRGPAGGKRDRARHAPHRIHRRGRRRDTGRALGGLPLPGRGPCRQQGRPPRRDDAGTGRCPAPASIFSRTITSTRRRASPAIPAATRRPPSRRCRGRSPTRCSSSSSACRGRRSTDCSPSPIALVFGLVGRINLAFGELAAIGAAATIAGAALVSVGGGVTTPLAGLGAGLSRPCSPARSTGPSAAISRSPGSRHAARSRASSPLSACRSR